MLIGNADKLIATLETIKTMIENYKAGTSKFDNNSLIDAIWKTSDTTLRNNRETNWIERQDHERHRGDGRQK
jgi:hypothetical protein